MGVRRDILCIIVLRLEHGIVSVHFLNVDFIAYDVCSLNAHFHPILRTIIILVILFSFSL